ncbi:MAG: response regulator [Sphingobacteriia bacterium]|nr:response regulator [Sphingobacteriia bacterium]
MQTEKFEKRYTILIVDDIPKNIELAANILQAKNYNITFATSGEAALEKVKSIDFDLILLDVMMPGMDGFEVCRLLKENSNTKDIPIIFLTAKSETENIVKGFELGAVDYVTKPFSTEELLARVKTHIDIRRKYEEKTRLEQQLSKQTESEQSAFRSAIEQELEQKKKELGSITLFYDLRSQLDKLIQDKSPVARMEIRHIKEMISNLFIDKSNQDFHKALKKEFPKLTFDDLRLCSYLKQRFLNVEIAEFLETSPEAVYTRKSRLRQKLNLGQDTDINEFLSNYKY